MPRGQSTCSLAMAAWIVGGIWLAPAWGQPEASAVDVFDETSPLLVEPKTPEEMFAATLLTLDLARLDLAKRYLKQFVETNPDGATLIALRDKHGTAEFLRLSRVPELQGDARGVLERLIEASRKQADDPAFVEELIRKFGGDAVQRELAVRELRNLGESAVPHLIRRLADSPSAEEIDRVVQILARMGRPAIAPAVAGLDSPRPTVRLAALKALGLIRGREAAAFLWHPAFASSESPAIQEASRQALARILTGSEKIPEQLTADVAARELLRLTRGYYFREFEFATEDDGTVPLWAWDEQAATVVRRQLPANQAELMLAMRFARQSLDLSPTNAEAQRMSLGTRLGWEVASHGRHQTLSLDPGTAGYTALSAGEETVAQVLADALAARRPAAAQGALQVLGQIGSREQILGASGRKSPVLSALNYPDLRVQFAAANTVLRMEPTQAFRGADRVVSILNRAITNTENAKGLIVDADTSRAEVTAGYLSSLGYMPVQVRTGKEGFRVAATQAGIELAVIHINCIDWDLTQTVANLRADARTAYLPLAFYGPEDVTADPERSDVAAYPHPSSTLWKGVLPPVGREAPLKSTSRSRLRRLIEGNAPAVFIAESGSASDFVRQLRPFLAGLKDSQLTGEERGEYQAAAVRWLAHLAQSDRGRVFDLTRTENSLADLLDDARLGPTALAALAGLATKSVQGRLVQIVVNPLDAPSLRTSAAHHLAFHLQRHGILLAEDQLRELHLAWKRETDPVVSSALATVVGSLRPDQKVVGERLRK